MAARSIAQPWLISKWFDPVFAVSMGFSAAALRIQRESKEQHPERDNSLGAQWERGKIMTRNYFGYSQSSAKT